MIRRLKSDVLKQLPPKLRNTVMLKVQDEEDLERLEQLNKETQGISRVLNACMGKVHSGNAQAVEMFASVGKETQQQVMRAFTECADIKMNLVIDHVVRIQQQQCPCSCAGTCPSCTLEPVCECLFSCLTVFCAGSYQGVLI
jgi:hypothetical protein